MWAYFTKVFRIFGFLFFILCYSPIWGQETKSSTLSTEASIISNGAKIFQANCLQCHQVHKKVIGPKLANVSERKELPWLLNFIKYPQKVIDGGDDYAVGLYKEYKQYMPNHDFLSDEEILSILSYIKDETEKGAPQEDLATSDVSVDIEEMERVNNSLLIYLVIGLFFILFVLLVMASSLLTAFKKNILNQKKELLNSEDIAYIEKRFHLRDFLFSKSVLTIVFFVFIAVVSRSSLAGLFDIGVQQGYAPDQPIPFSHKLHAGFYEIDCKYCHTGVAKSKNANLPSLNICMNCHNTIKTTSPEIQKIYAHLESDTPIEWVRVHNLPDLSYFNHAQHVQVANIECETCHGDIQNMEIVQQHSLLTMGWCIDCHRTTEVQTKDNAYYERMVNFQELKGKKVIHVEDIGGLECSKCHY